MRPRVSAIAFILAFAAIYAVAAQTVTPNSPYVEGANAIVVQGGGSPPTVVSRVQADSGRNVVALWLLDGRGWSYYLPAVPAASTLNALPPVANLFVVLGASSAPQAVPDGCEPRPSAQQPMPVADPRGPYYHQVVMARSDDGRSVSNARQVLEHASVPDGVLTSNGRLLIYYVNGADGGVWVASADQVEGSASALSAISINGVSRPVGVVDPDATALPDGGVRLAYLSGFGPPRPGSGQTWTMCIADSGDGINFRVVGKAMQFNFTATDPSLVQLTDGSWLMAVSAGRETIMARSSDGLRFEQYARLTYGGVPELARLSDGRVRLYVCAQGIESYVSADRGASWQREGVVVRSYPGKAIVCDPSFVPDAGVFIFKTAD